MASVNESVLKKRLGITLGLFGRELFIEGGPFVKRPKEYRTFGVNMASEIDEPSDIHVPIVDFSIPTGFFARRRFVRAAALALRASLRGEDVYVGCWGGVGRTGMMFAAMAKICGVKVPITHVRTQYDRHAVETLQQVEFISNLNVGAARRHLARRRLLSGLIGW